MNWTINTSLPINYEIKTSQNLFAINNKDLIEYCKSGHSLVVIDKTVSDLYGKLIHDYFIHHGIVAKYVFIKGIELKKNLGSLYEILFEMEQFGIPRNSEPVLAIGGGVIQDLVGMACGMYRRGVPYVRIPTTLIGIVDVSVAAKTGINFENRRNRLGSYYPPMASLLDTSFIKTLESIEISSGLGEILKMAVIKDALLFDILKIHGKELFEKKFEYLAAKDVVIMAIQGMKEELENNLWEKELKRCVDFGHSFSPIIEMRSLNRNDALTHGQAVTLDIILSCIISCTRGLMTEDDLMDVFGLVGDLGLLTWHELFSNPELLLEALKDTTKHRGGNQNLPIPTKIGEYTFINDLSYREICDAVDAFNKINGK